MGDPRDDERGFDESEEFEIVADDEDLLGLEKLDENGDPIPTSQDDDEDREASEDDEDDVDDPKIDDE